MTRAGPPDELQDEDGSVVRLRSDRDGRPILDQFAEEGFVDSVFRIDELKRERTHLRFHLAASFEEEVLGFECRVLRGIKAAFSKKMELENVHHDAVEFVRSGAESDRLVRVMAKRYGHTRVAKARMVSSVLFTGIALHQGSLDLETQPVKIKLLSPDEDAKRYNESFFNLDLRNRLVFWNEKDPEYRRPLLKALSA